MKQQQSSITSLPASPAEERKWRMIKYTIATGIRMICIVLAIVIHGWISIPFIVGAIVLPYFAVIGANVSNRAGVDVIAPDDRAVQRYVPTEQAPGAPAAGFQSASFPDGQWQDGQWQDGRWQEPNWQEPAWRDADSAWRAEQAASAERAARTSDTEGTDRS